MRHLCICLAALTAACSAPAAAPQADGHFSIENLIDVKHPSAPLWSPDGRHVAFVWDRAGISNVFVADLGGAAPRAVTSFTSGQVPGFFWSRDSRTIYLPHDGELWMAPADGGQPRAAWSSTGGGRAAGSRANAFAPSPDGTRVAFVRDHDLVVHAMADGKELVVASDPESIGGISWSPDGKHIAFAAGSKTIRPEQTPEYSGAKITYTIFERTPSQTFVVASTGGTPVKIGTPGGFGGVRWIDASHIVFDRQSSDFKHRTTYEADIAGGATKTIHDDADEKFWSIPGDAGAAAQPSPDGKWVAFVSDRDGWDHIYVMPTGSAKASSEPIQITKGNFEAWRPVWSPDSTRIAFDANAPGQPGDRQLSVVTIGSDPAHATIATITSGRGTNTWPQWSPDGKRLVYQHTDPENSADLWVIDAQPTAKPSRLSDSMPTAIDKKTLVEPELVHYAGPDGQQVPAWLFVPKNLDRSRRHPAIVWIHGDGINQNYDGWHVQRNYAVYYSFHQYLLQKGYVVIAPDYRGSIGYGRAWRQGVYMDVGGNDAKDAWMATSYLKTLPYVDIDRVGVWGLSYGGFFTLISVTDQPKMFRAAVDVAGVVDYAMYYEDPYHGGWTASRIGTPEQNPKVYAQASPLSHIDRLERPLLVLHGTADVNVPYLHSVRLIDEALKKGKGGLLSFMVYPGEFHYFTREHVLRDAWRRVDEFFQRELQPGAGVTTSH